MKPYRKENREKNKGMDKKIIFDARELFTDQEKERKKVYDEKKKGNMIDFIYGIIVCKQKSITRTNQIVKSIHDFFQKI